MHQIGWAKGQQRIVLLDETVLTNPVGGPEVAAGQLRHLTELVSGEEPDGRGVHIRILPLGQALFVHSLHSPAEVVLHDNRLVMTVSLVPRYESGSGAARALSAGLREAVSAAWSREKTHELLATSAEKMERRAGS